MNALTPERFATLSRQPQTRAEVARHELAHGIAACLACAEHHEGLYAVLTVSICVMSDQEGEAHETFSCDVSPTAQTHIAALSAVGPVALLPSGRLKRVLRSDTFGTAGVLSEPDVAQLRRGDLTQSQTHATVLATFYALRQLGESGVSRLCNILLAARKSSIDVPALVLLPRARAAAALEAVPRLAKAVSADTDLREVLR